MLDEKPDENLPAKLIMEELDKLPACIDRKNFTPFRAEPKRIEDSLEFRKILTPIFDQEAERLGLSPERYEYSNINEMYQPKHPILDTHYFIFDPGPGLIRGILGNFLGKEMKKHGKDIGKLFEKIGFKFSEVLFRLPGVDVGGYGNFHEFLNIVNPHLRDYNLFIAYVREEDSASFRHGFYDHLGLIEGIPCPGLGKIVAGEVDMYPVKQIENGYPFTGFYEVEVKGGKLAIAPIASCNWNLTYIENISDDEIKKLDAEEVPVRDRDVYTFHFLNGVTPHYFKKRLEDALSTIRRYNKLHDNKK